ncbi:MAG: hypothetical protein FJ098_01905, partial [Deltaproteobacteria bacterium]|nr:hypothetical protein [Deltaproteobacteria bacterium]
MTVRPRAPMLLLTAVVAACAPVDRGGGPGDTAPPVSIRDLVAVPNPANVLSYYVWWTTDRASSTALDLDCGEHAVTITGPGLREDHEVVVLGLYPGAACTFIARSEAPDRGTGEASVTVEAGAPPSDTLPPLDVAVPSSDRTQSGWTVFNLSHAGDPQPPVVAVVDPAGRYRWYHVRATGISSSGMVVRRVPEGFLMGGGSDGASSWPALVDLEGRVLWEEELPYEHHEILPWGPDGQDVLFLSRTVSCPAGIPQSATVVAWDRSESRPLWEWSLCEHYAPEEIGDPDWDHTNAIVPVP